MFKEHETCETPGTCKELCQRALLIEQETRNVVEKIATSTDLLEKAVNNATCKHSDSEKATKQASRILVKNLNH